MGWISDLWNDWKEGITQTYSPTGSGITTKGNTPGIHQKQPNVDSPSANSAKTNVDLNNNVNNGGTEQYINSVNGYGDGLNSATAYNEWARQSTLDWQERMSRNSHTYEVEDLKRAGLNPILSANGGMNSYAGVSSSYDNSAEIAQIQAKTTLAAAAINASSAANVASIYANATKYSSDNSYKASTYATDQNNFMKGITSAMAFAGSIARYF